MGLPLVENRPLTPDEIADLERRARRPLQNTFAVVYGYGTPLMLVGPLFVAGQVGEWMQLFPALANAIVVFYILLLFPGSVLYLRSRDVYKQSKGLRKDIRAGFVKRFVASNDVLANETGPENGGDRLETGDTVSPPVISIEVLPCSRRLWKRNDVRVLAWTETNWTKVAEPPESAAAIAAWVEPLQVRDGKVTPTLEQRGRRDLTVAEKDELRLRIRRLWLGPFWPALFFSAWLLIPLAVCLVSRTPIHPKPLTYVLAVFLVFSYWRLTMESLLAWRMNSDRLGGETAILRVPIDTFKGDIAVDGTGATADLVHTQGQAGEQATVVVEVLPLSGLTWTEDGRPAAWRKIPNQ